MSMTLRPLVLSVALAGAALTAATASSRTAVAPASTAPVCGPRGQDTLAQDARARVYRSNRSVWGCARGTAHAWNLGASSGHQSIYLAAVGGVRTAYATEFMGVDTSSSRLTERRLDTGEITATPAVSDMPSGVESFESIAALVIRPSGAVAWTVSVSSIGAPHGSRTELRTYTRGHAHTLERNHGLDVHSLSLRGSRLRWRDATGWHSTQLG